ncbi:hypothetical protein EAL2_c01090 [Peptoclostridium acidaminophilum DSM 3953]|uniref:Uncharacterized protein n=1 Tax=Peptoclostridium acidaminophilum DSM 3953 TaxID=1286171 RepID=W8U369_PEPAC|nr:hypothetical protein EAL2_c01090 [Peptoclostridium acidaminophilum DSM 3953]
MLTKNMKAGIVIHVVPRGSKTKRRAANKEIKRNEKKC